MKNKVLFLCLILTLSGLGLWYKTNLNQTKTVSDWISHIQNKETALFYEKTDIPSLLESISDDYSIFVQKTENTDSPIEDTLGSIKNSVLGFIYKNFNGDLKLLIESYFSNEEEFGLFYDNERILNFIKRIKFETAKVEKIDSQVYKISFENASIENKIFTVYVITKTDADGYEKITGFKDFYLTLSDIEKTRQSILNAKNDNVKREIDSSVLITFFETKLDRFIGRFDSENFTLTHKIKIKNLSDKPIIGLKYKVWVYNKDVDQYAEKIISSNKPILPNEEIEESTVNILPQFHYFIDNFNQYPKAEVIQIEFSKYKLEYLKDISWE